jgi:hypothetical protein
MKTLKQVTKERDELILELKNKNHANVLFYKSSEYKNGMNQIRIMNDIIMYLETFPSEKFLHNELTRLQTLIDSKENQFQEYKKSSPGNNLSQKELLYKYRSMYNRTSLIYQKNVLTYILN